MASYTIDLSPEQLSKLPGITPYEDAANPTFSKTFGAAEMAGADLDDPDDVKRQQEDQIFDGSTYKPVGNDVEGSDENAKFNEEVYNNTGQPQMGGMFRTQQVTNPDGSKQSYIVPEPGSNVFNKQGNDVLQGFDRVVGGAGLEAAKGVLGFGEWAIKNTPVASDLAQQILGPEVGNKEINWINENFPTMPAQNDMERVAQEIGSAVLGGAAGGMVASDLTKLPAVEQGIAQAAQAFLTKAQKLDPANAAQKMQTFIKAMLIERGADLGGAITTPDHTESISGGIANAIDPNLSKSVGEQFPQVNQEKVGNFVDNVVGSSLLNIFGKGIKAGGKAFGNAFFKSNPTTDTQLAEQLLRQVDPNLANTSKEEFARRAQIFADSIKANQEKQTSTFTFNRTPSTAMNAGGAKKYVEEAYSFLKPEMSAEAWEAFVKKNSEDIANNISAIRRDNLKSTIVQAADAQVNKQAFSALDNAANQMGSPEDIQNAGEALGQGVINQKQSATDMLTVPTRNADEAANALSAENQKSYIINKFNQLKKSGSLANSPNAEQQFLNNLSGEQLYQNWKKSYDAYNNAFESLPNGIPYDKDALVDTIINSGDAPGILERLGLKGEGNLVPKAPLDVTDPAVRENYRQELLAGLAGTDLKWLYNQARPLLADTITKAASPSGGLGVETHGIQAIKTFIDTTAKKSGDSRFQNAMDLYKQHMDKFGQIDDLKNYNTAAAAVNNSNIGKGKDQLYITGRQIVDNAIQGGDQSGIYADNVIRALTDGQPEQLTKEMGDVVLSMAIKSLADSKGPAGSMDTTSLQSAMQRYLPFLQKTNPDAVKVYHETIDAIRAAEIGSGDATKALELAKGQAKQIMDEANRSAAAKFLTSEGHITEDVTKTFNQIFNSADQTRQIMDRAIATGDQQVVDGIQSQYLHYLADKMFTNRTIAAGGDNTFVTEASGSRVGNFLEGSDTTPQTVAKIIFEQKPQVLQDMFDILNEVHLDQMSRQNRPQAFTSNTAIDNARQKNMSLIIAAVWGRLNRTATTIGAFSSAITSKMKETDQAKIDTIVPNLIANADYITSVLNRLGENPNKDAIDAAANIIAGTRPTQLGRGVLAAAKDEEYNNDNLDQQTNQAFGQTPNSGKPPEGQVVVQNYTGSDGIKHNAF